MKTMLRFFARHAAFFALGSMAVLYFGSFFAESGWDSLQYSWPAVVVMVVAGAIMALQNLYELNTAE